MHLLNVSKEYYHYMHLLSKDDGMIYKEWW
jgi:hypothetical protein